MLEQIAGAQAALEAQLELLRHAATTGGDAASLAAAQNQLSRLGGLSQRIEHAHGNLTSIRAEVTAFVAATQAFVQQARTAGAIAQAAEVALHTASAAARQEVGSFVDAFYEKKIFEPYLQFASTKDEEAYRKREAERREAIETALAKGTPAGNLRAAELALEQMDDAGAHGADRSPDFADRRTRLQQATSQLRDASPVAASEKSTVAAQAPGADPFEAIAPEVSQENAALLARFKAAGIVVSETETVAHGVGGEAGSKGGLRLS